MPFTQNENQKEGIILLQVVVSVHLQKEKKVARFAKIRMY